MFDWPSAAVIAGTAASDATRTVGRIRAPARRVRRRLTIGYRIGFLAVDRRGSGRRRLRPDTASQAEDEEHRARRHLLETLGRVDEPFVPGAAQTDEDGDILLAVDGEGHRRCGDAGLGGGIPEVIERLWVEAVDHARLIAGQ